MSKILIISENQLCRIVDKIFEQMSPVPLPVKDPKLMTPKHEKDLRVKGKPLPTKKIQLSPMSLMGFDNFYIFDKILRNLMTGGENSKYIYTYKPYNYLSTIETIIYEFILQKQTRSLSLTSNFPSIEKIKRENLESYVNKLSSSVIGPGGSYYKSVKNQFIQEFGLEKSKEIVNLISDLLRNAYGDKKSPDILYSKLNNIIFK